MVRAVVVVSAVGPSKCNLLDAAISNDRQCCCRLLRCCNAVEVGQVAGAATIAVGNVEGDDRKKRPNRRHVNILEIAWSPEKLIR